MCFVFIWEQTATCATYSINWSVFITEMKSVYSAVRTESLNKAVCASSLKGSFPSTSLPSFIKSLQEMLSSWNAIGLLVINIRPATNVVWYFKNLRHIVTLHFVYLLRVPKYAVLRCWNTAVAVKPRSDNDEPCRDFSVVVRFRCKLLPEAALQNRPPRPAMCLADLCFRLNLEQITNQKDERKSNLFQYFMLLWIMPFTRLLPFSVDK